MFTTLRKTLTHIVWTKRRRGGLNRRGKGSKRLGRRERSREAVVKAREGGSRRSGGEGKRDGS